MRRVFISFLLGIFLLVVAIYFFANISPFDTSKLATIINANNIQANDWTTLENKIVGLVDKGEILSYLSESAYICDLIISLGIFFIFFALHLTLDKLFFKNFYEQASIGYAIRRGIFFVLCLNLMLFFKLYGADISIILIVPLIFIILEVLFSSYFHKPVADFVGKIKEKVDMVNEGTKLVKKN